jgi:hypothetical protein
MTTTEDIVLAELPTFAHEPDYMRHPTAWDISEATGLPIGNVRWGLRQIENAGNLVVSSYQSWGHTSVHYARANT